jgi:excisionase family DNA binding protein
MASSIFNPVSVPSDQIEQVKALHQLLGAGGSARFVGKDESSIELTDTLRLFLLKILRNLERGDAVSIVPISQEVTVHQAAELLGVPHTLVKELIETEQLPAYSVGVLRRIRLTDLLAYKDRQRQLRLEALSELTRYDQELGMSGTVSLPSAQPSGAGE